MFRNSAGVVLLQLYKVLLWCPVRSMSILKTFRQTVLCFGGLCVTPLIGVHGVSAGGRSWDMDWSCSTTGNPILPVGLGLPRDTSRCVGYHGYCIRSKVCPKPFAAFGTCSWRQKTCCVGMCGNPAQAGNVWRGEYWSQQNDLFISSPNSPRPLLSSTQMDLAVPVLMAARSPRT